MKRFLGLALALVFAFSGRAAPQGNAQESGAPAPPATYASEAELLAGVKKALEGGTAMGAGRVANTDGYRINLIRRTAPAGAIVHADGHEVHHITEGTATIVTGGRVIRTQGQPGRIEGGTAQRVAKGDVILIPVNTPHQYTVVDGAVSYLEIRFAPVPAK